MGYFEILLFRKLSFNLGNKVTCFLWRHFRRYLEDGQIMWDTRSGRFYLNRINNFIKFTASCSTKEIVFLDVRVLKTENGFETIVFNRDSC